MTAAAYRAALARLGWDHHRAARELDITVRTSQRYSKSGAPKVVELALCNWWDGEE